MESYGSDSFIYAILERQSKIRVPLYAHLWREFFKNDTLSCPLHSCGLGNKMVSFNPPPPVFSPVATREGAKW